MGRDQVHGCRLGQARQRGIDEMGIIPFFENIIDNRRVDDRIAQQSMAALGVQTSLREQRLFFTGLKSIP